MASPSMVAPGLTGDLGEFASLTLEFIPALTLFLTNLCDSSVPNCFGEISVHGIFLFAESWFF